MKKCVQHTACQRLSRHGERHFGRRWRFHPFAKEERSEPFEAQFGLLERPQQPKGFCRKVAFSGVGG